MVQQIYWTKVIYFSPPKDKKTERFPTAACLNKNPKQNLPLLSVCCFALFLLYPLCFKHQLRPRRRSIPFFFFCFNRIKKKQRLLTVVVGEEES